MARVRSPCRSPCLELADEYLDAYCKNHRDCRNGSIDSIVLFIQLKACLAPVGGQDREEWLRKHAGYFKSAGIDRLPMRIRQYFAPKS
jgi:hypothetical protein